LDETADNHGLTIQRLQKLEDDQEQLVTSHHIVEEVLFVLSKLDPGADLVKVVAKISKLPGLILVEPSPNMGFAGRYSALSQKLKLGVNDALIMQLMIDASITKLFSYDKQFVNQAAKLNIGQAV